MSDLASSRTAATPVSLGIRDVREFCRVHGVNYQGFALLTANRQTLTAEQLAQIAARHRRTIPQIVFRFAIQIGMIPLTGTTDPEHM